MDLETLEIINHLGKISLYFVILPGIVALIKLFDKNRPKILLSLVILIYIFNEFGSYILYHQFKLSSFVLNQVIMPIEFVLVLLLFEKSVKKFISNKQFYYLLATFVVCSLPGYVLFEWWPEYIFTIKVIEALILIPFAFFCIYNGMTGLSSSPFLSLFLLLVCTGVILMHGSFLFTTINGQLLSYQIFSYKTAILAGFGSKFLTFLLYTIALFVPLAEKKPDTSR